MNVRWWGLFFALATVVAAHERVLLRDVSTVLFEAGKISTASRGSPVNQLVQVGGPHHYVPQIMCTNSGWDGRQVIWECRLPNSVPADLDQFEVTCQGYDRPGDPYILAGSCGIEYSLKPKPSARPPPPPPPRAAPQHVPQHVYVQPAVSSASETSSIVLPVVMSMSVFVIFAVVFGIVIAACFDMGPFAPSPTRTTVRVTTTSSPPVPPSVARSSSFSVKRKDKEPDYDDLDDIDDPPRRGPSPARSIVEERVVVEERPRTVYVQGPAPAPVQHVVHTHSDCGRRDSGYTSGVVDGMILGGITRPRAPVIVQAPAPAPVVHISTPAPAPAPVESSSSSSSWGGSSGSWGGGGGFSSSSAFGGTKTR